MIFRIDSGNSDSLRILVGMLLSIDYEKAVMEDYQIKKRNGDLSLILTNPTPSTLRDECLAVCEKRYEKNDNRALSLFFKPAADKEAFLKIIDGWKTDKFRPLVKYLKGGTQTPEPKNVEILAWLIDFQPRPVDKFKSSSEVSTVSGKDLEGNSVEKAKAQVLPIEDDKIEDEPAPEVDEPIRRAFNFNLVKATGLIILIILVIIGTRFCTGPANMPETTARAGPKACMFWDGDHYQQVKCGQKHGDTVVRYLDSGLLGHFRMIAGCPVTTNKEWKGKFWRGRDKNGKIEFFTNDGFPLNDTLFHPIDTPQRLHPVTDYILKKYCP
jgi:hypothetical protein